MKKQITLVLALGLTGFSATAQQALKVAPGKAGMYPAAVQFKPGQEPEFIRGTVMIQDKGAFSRTSDVILRHSEADQIGQEHFRYQQKINNIPVEGAIYAVHVAAGKIKSQNGDWVAESPANLPQSPVINEQMALDKAMKDFGAEVYKWEMPNEEAFIKAESGDQSATFRPKAELVYYSGEAEVNIDKMRLAYKLDLYAHEPVGRRIYFIDAQNGAVLGSREVIHHANATGTAITGYSGTQSIVTDQFSGGFRLREAGRGNGIMTFNLNKGTSYSAATDFVDADNYWNNANANLDQYATDAHWGAEATYDYFKMTYGRNSIDNKGFTIMNYVHYSSNFFNAFWDGARMTYGDGNATYGNKPLTSLDVCGHEITHGLTSFTANLNYSKEPGALNEGFSDIFGTVIEFFASPSTANWTIGEQFGTIRSMSNPNAFGQPDTYMGNNWYTGAGDNYGVHTNSGVLNFWFYLLTNGGTGTNDKSFAYSVSGIGLSKAAAIAYRTLTVYLVPTSEYSDARNYSIQAAIDLYGENSNEVKQVNNAWDAVNVHPPVPLPPCTDEFESNEDRYSAKLIPLNTDIVGKISTAADQDWFYFNTTTAAPKLKVTLTNLPADYSVILYKSTGLMIGNSMKKGLASETIINNTYTTGATFYVSVMGKSTDFSNEKCYMLRASTGNTNMTLDGSSAGFGEDVIIGQEGRSSNVFEVSDEALTVFPNPAKDRLSMSFSSEVAGKQNITITDLVGSVIMVKTVDVQAGLNTITVSLNNYRSGMYFLNMSGKRSARFQVTE